MSDSKNKRLRTPVAAVLAASLTAAALARAAHAQDPGRLERALDAGFLFSIAREVAGDALLAASAARALEERRRGRDAALSYDPASGHGYARELESHLRRLDPRRAPTWEQRRKAFDARLDEARKSLARQARPFAGSCLVATSRELATFARAYRADLVGSLDEQPRDELVREGRAARARAVLRRSRDPAPPAEELAAGLGVPLVVLPSDVGDEGTRGFVDFHEALVARTLAALTPRS
jgi:hypothetical protein